eukprot:14807858-Ditylum_brightwellii.AAC.1
MKRQGKLLMLSNAINEPKDSWLTTKASQSLASQRLRFKSWLGLLVVETQVNTCIEEASGSAKPSGYSGHGMPPCHTDYRRWSVEQFAEMHASGLDPADLGVISMKGRNGHVNLNGVYNNQYMLLPIWGG